LHGPLLFDIIQIIAGLLERLTAEGAAAGADPDVTALLQSAVLHVVPNMCPDGSVRYSSRSRAV
jgi:murein tripeptide amidase MpaA